MTFGKSPVSAAFIADQQKFFLVCVVTENNGAAGTFIKAFEGITVSALGKVYGAANIIDNEACAFRCNNKDNTLSAVAADYGNNPSVKISDRMVDTHNISADDRIFLRFSALNNTVVQPVLEAETLIIRVHRGSYTYSDEFS